MSENESPSVANVDESPHEKSWLELCDEKLYDELTEESIAHNNRSSISELKCRKRTDGGHKVAKSTKYSDVHTTEEYLKPYMCRQGSKRELEVNPEILDRRQKQIDYGKNTNAYEKYLQLIPKNKRNKFHPKTPPKDLKMSRRAWDGLVRNWRVKLHQWDTTTENDCDVEKYHS